VELQISTINIAKLVAIGVTYPATHRPGYATSSPLSDFFLLQIPFKLIKMHKRKELNDMHNNNQQACIF
jgi:hypothetical protein